MLQNVFFRICVRIFCHINQVFHIPTTRCWSGCSGLQKMMVPCDLFHSSRQLLIMYLIYISKCIYLKAIYIISHNNALMFFTRNETQGQNIVAKNCCGWITNPDFFEFTICVCRNSYGLTNTEICINTLLSSLLDR